VSAVGDRGEHGITGLAHAAVCVPDVEAAVRWYESVVGLDVLSPPYLMQGEAVARDMGELIPTPRLKAAIVGFRGDGDRVLEVIEYPGTDGRARPVDASITDHGLTHFGLVCSDLEATRSDLEERGVEFLTRGIASIAGLRTTWFSDPWGVVFILMEKRDATKPYFAQY
jgi:catechol 2,3-dioxygenase-like lactoylglutathione lyase family enzyme